MEKNIKQFNRDKDKVFKTLSIQEDQSVLATVPTRIYIPENYLNKKLAIISSEVSILSICAIVTDDGSYGVLKACAMMNISPTIISSVKFNDEKYLEFYFEPGSKIINNLELVMDDTLVYQIFNYFISKGHIPWFLNYTDVCTLFDTAQYHSGMSLDASHSILEMIGSAISRDSENFIRYYRQLITDINEIETKPPTFIPLRNITYGATDTASRLLGSYFDEGINSALVNPVDKTEKVEQLLRG